MTLDLIAPSGDQYEIAYDDQRAVVVAVGGGVREYTVGDRAILDGYPKPQMADGARGQALVPWPNRVKDGKWTWQGKEMQLALTEPEQHNAIHGLARWLGWRAVERDDTSVCVACTTYPQTGYPWPLRVRNLYSLGPDGLRVQMSVTNLGTLPAPVAAGMHPYITAGTATVGEAELHIPAATWLPTGEQQIPTGREPVEGSAYDFRTPRLIGDTQIDYTFTDLERGDDERFRLRLRDPGTGRAVTFWVGPAFPFVEVFTGDALPDESRRRQGLGVEPMTAPPNALATGESLVVLEAGASWTGEWGITPD
ncbi:MAG: aldose 1-epimerase family protein [Frankiales bacterium]|nr:aldose 1-epimerase family protein [Frankiales bacterium]